MDRASAPPLCRFLPPRYRVDRVLSHGERNTTLEVFDTSLRQAKAVVKVQQLGEEQGASECEGEFRRFCAKLVSIRHDLIAVPYTFGTFSSDSGSVFGYSAREFVSGTPLSSVGLPMSEDAAVTAILQVCYGLDAVHAIGLYHCDLKPENVIVRRAPGGRIDGLSQCVLIDFSYRPAGPSGGLTEVTLQYVAPEMLTGQPADQRTDLYALGVMLYRFLSGRFPFDGGSLPEVMRKQRSREFTPLGAIRSSLASGLRKAVDGLLEPNPANRPESVHALIALIDEFKMSAPATGSGVVRHGGFIGRGPEITECLTALDLERASAGTTSVAVSGARGSGVTAFLRELQDRVEAQGVTVLTGTPRALHNTPLQAQLCAAIHALVRQPTVSVTSGRLHAPDTSTELLDDMFTVAHERRVVLFVDDWSLCDVSERHFVQRLILQDKAAIQGTAGRAGRCQVVIGDSRESGTLETCEALTRVVEKRIHLNALSQQETAALIASAGSLPGLCASRVHAASGGHPKAIRAILSHIAECGVEGSVESVEGALVAVADSAADSDRDKEVCYLRGRAYGDALLALAVWGDDLSPERWQALLGHLGGIATGQSPTDHVDSHGLIRSRHQHLGEYLARRLGDAERTKIGDAVLAVTWSDWRSSDPETLLPLLRFVGRLGYLPRRGGSRVCRALIILLERGRLADLESVTAPMVRFRAAPWWTTLFREAARAGSSGRTPSPEGATGSIDEPASFFRSWIRARQLMRARYRHEALQILDALSASQLPCARAVALALAEDHALATAEARAHDRLVGLKRRILGQVSRWLPLVRKRNRPHDAPTIRVRIRACRKVARYQRVRSRAHLLMGNINRAIAACRRERLLNRADGNLLREASCLNNEGILLIRTHADRTAAAILERCVRLRGRLDDEHGAVIALNNLAAALSVGGNLGGAAAALNRARIIATRNGLGRLRNLALVNLAVAYSRRGQLLDAQRVLRQARRHGRDDDDADALARSLSNSGSVCVDRWNPGAAERYAAGVDRLMAIKSECPRDVRGDLIRAEMAYRSRDWAHLHTVIARSGRGAQTPDTAVYEARLAIEAGDNAARRSFAAEHACTPGARLRLVLLRRRRGRISCRSLERVVALARRHGVVREACEWIVAHLARPENDSSAGVDLGLKSLAWFEFREGHDDLQIELRSRLAGILRAKGRHAEAWRLIEDALLRFRKLERRLRRWPRGVHVLLHLQERIQHALTGSAVGRPDSGQELSAALCAQAFDVLLDNRKMRPGTHDRHSDALLRLGVALSKGGDIEQVLDEVLAVAVGVTGAQRAVLVVGTATDRSVRRTVLADGSGAVPGAVEISWAVVSQVLASGEASVFSDALTAEELASHRSIAVLKLRSLACVPLRAGGQVLGALYLDHHGIAGLISEDMLGLLELLAGVIGTTLLTQRLEEQAVTARRELAETHRHIMRAERNRVAGELAGGLVHDLKNVLAAVSGRAQLLRRMNQDPQVLRSLDSIEKAAGTGVGLVQRLQECARDHSSQSEEPVDLTAVVHEAVELLGPRLEKSRVRAVIQGTPDSVVWGVAGEYREMLLNLFVNACDAMPEGGTLSVALAVDPQAGHVVVTVSDTGVGMSAETQARLFEPFYTTKGNSGTGLGLVVVKSVVVRHGGSIAVQSQPGAGTRFHVALPRPRG